MGGQARKIITAETAEGAEMIRVNDLQNNLGVLCVLCGETSPQFRAGVLPPSALCPARPAYGNSAASANLRRAMPNRRGTHLDRSAVRETAKRNPAMTKTQRPPDSHGGTGRW